MQPSRWAATESRRNPIKTPRLTVGIISYNSERYLDACLRSVLREVSGLSAEVIVVDNRSEDGSTTLVRERYPQVRLVVEERNKGYGAGCNRIFSEGSGDLLLFLNPDVELKESCLLPLLRFLDDHPRAGIVGCRLTYSDGSLQKSCGSFPSLPGYFFESTFLYRAFPRNRVIGRYHLSYMDYGKPTQVDVLLGAFLLLRREMYDRIGGMDQRFFMYSEEIDLCYRAKVAGWEVWYVPGGVAIHHHGKSTESIPERMFLENHRSKVLYMRIHGGATRAAAARLILLIGALLRASLWSGIWMLRGPFSGGTRRNAARRARTFWRVVSLHLGLVSEER